MLIFWVLFGVCCLFAFLGGFLKDNKLSVVFRWPSLILLCSCMIIFVKEEFHDLHMIAVSIALIFFTVRSSILLLSTCVSRGEDEPLPDWLYGTWYGLVAPCISAFVIAIAYAAFLLLQHLAGLAR